MWLESFGVRIWRVESSRVCVCANIFEGLSKSLPSDQSPFEYFPLDEKFTEKNPGKFLGRRTN